VAAILSLHLRSCSHVDAQQIQPVLALKYHPTLHNRSCLPATALLWSSLGVLLAELL